MAISTLYTSATFSPVYNENVSVYSSTNSGEEKFQIAFDVVIDGTTQSTYKLPVNLDGYVVSDVHPHLQPWVKYDLGLTLQTFTLATQSYNRYNLGLYEEYVHRPAFTTVSNDGGFTRYNFTSNTPYQIGDRLNIYDSSESTYNGSQVVTYVYSPIWVVTDKAYVATATGNAVYADSRTTKTWIGESFTSDLTFYNGVYDTLDFIDYDELNFYPTTAGGTGSLVTTVPTSGSKVYIDDVIYFNYLNYNGNALYIPLYMIITSDNGTFRITNSYTTLSTPTEEYLKVGIGPWNLINTTDSVTVISGSLPIIDANTTSYTVHFTNSTPTTISETYEFNMTQNCSIFENFKFHYLNARGSWNCINMILNNKKKLKVNRADYNQNYGSFDGTTWGYNTYDRGRTNIRTIREESYTVNSDYVDETNAQKILECFYSNSVYLIRNGKLIGVNIDTDSLEEKKRLDGLINYTFKFTYSFKNNTQRY